MSVFNREHDVVFVHIPKTAGTSMEKCYFLGGSGHTEIHKYVNQPGFDDAFKFAFVRNPWDRYVSAFYHFFGKDGRPFEIGMHTGRHFWPMHPYICNRSGELLVDFVGRFENLLLDWEHVCAMVGIEPVTLPWHRKNGHPPYKECYTQEQWDWVAKNYAQDIEMFGYQEDSL